MAQKNPHIASVTLFSKQITPIDSERIAQRATERFLKRANHATRNAIEEKTRGHADCQLCHTSKNMSKIAPARLGTHFHSDLISTNEHKSTVFPQKHIMLVSFFYNIFDQFSSLAYENI